MASSVVSRVAGLGALTAAGQLVIIGTLPTYSRIFDPGPYGEYVIFVGAYTVVSVLAGVRYDSAIVLPRSPPIAGLLSLLVMAIAISVSTVIALSTMIAGLAWDAPERWTPLAHEFGYGLAAATAIGALQRCLISWCVRGGRFLAMGWAQFIFCGASVIAQLSFARFMDQLPALIWGYVCALALQTLCLTSRHIDLPVAGCTPSGLWRGVRVVARKYSRFPKYMVGYALASSARDRLIQVALGFGAGAAVVGRFGLAYRVVFAPNSLIYSAVSPVFFRLASRGSRLAVGRFAAGLVEMVFVLLVVPYVAFATEAPGLTDAVLSQRWHGTGPYLQALAGPALLLAATCWLDRAFDSFRRQNVAFALEASFTVAAVAVVACAAKLIDPVAVAWVFGGLALAYYWVYFLATFVACGFELADFRRVCLTGFMTASASLGLGALVHRIPQLSWRVVTYAGVMTAVILLWLMLRDGLGTLRMLMRSRLHTISA